MPWIMPGHPGRLDLATGQDEGSEDDRGHDHAEWIELRDVGHDDGREAVARREVLLQAVDDATDLSHAGQSGERAGEHEDEDRVARDVDARVARCRRRVADEPDLVAPPTALEDEPDDGRRDEREDEAEMDGQAGQAP